MVQPQHTNAIYALNSYTFKLLEVNEGWKKSDYSNRTPIVPAAQQPEFNDIGRDFIVYTSVVNPAPELWPVRSETLAYTIYSSSTTAADRIVGLLIEAFQRQDESATFVNQWLDAERKSNIDEDGNIINASRNQRLVSFLNVHSTIGEKSNPPEEEGGLYSAVVMVNLMYVTLSDENIQLTGFTYP